jgi:hypothetical protein
MNRYHLAQINIAEAKAEMDTKAMSGFVARLNRRYSTTGQEPPPG